MYLTDYKYFCTTNTELLDDILFPQVVNWLPETYMRVKSGLFYVPHVLGFKVLDEELVEKIKSNPANRTAFIFASGNSGMMGSLNVTRKESRLSYEYKIIPMTLTNVYAGKVANMFGSIQHISTDATACTSSMKALMDAQTLIRVYGFDRVIIYSTEDQVSNLTLEFFGEANASLLWDIEKTGVKPSAFDAVNYGFHVGQGAVLAVIESDRILKDTPKAKFLGAYTASEEFSNPLGQSPDGTGFKNAINMALECAQVEPNEVSIIKTHGTGTKSNNVAEKAAIESIFPDFIATSYKQKIGHTMGVSGLLETCMLIDDMRSGIVPKIENRTEKDDVFLSEDANIDRGTFVSLAAGMGNVYSAAILRVD